MEQGWLKQAAIRIDRETNAWPRYMREAAGFKDVGVGVRLKSWLECEFGPGPETDALAERLVPFILDYAKSAQES